MTDDNISYYLVVTLYFTSLPAFCFSMIILFFQWMEAGLKDQAWQVWGIVTLSTQLEMF